MVLAAYDSYERTLRRNAAEWRPYNPMSLTHSSEEEAAPRRGRGRYNAWLEDAPCAERRRRSRPSRRRVKTTCRRSSGRDWVNNATRQALLRARPQQTARAVSRRPIRAYGSYRHEAASGLVRQATPTAAGRRHGRDEA